MLSAAKHLQYLLENKSMQILRFAQDDRAGAFFSILIAPKPRGTVIELQLQQAGVRLAYVLDANLI